LAEEQSRRAEEQQQRAIEATRATRRQRILTIIASAMLLFFVIATIAAFAFAVNSVQTANALATQSAGLATESSRSQANADQAIRQRLTAEAAVGLYGGNLETQAAVINALLSATPTPTTEPTTPTPTPTAGNVISGDATPEPPTSTATSTPDLAATATANVLQEQLDNIRATQTAVAAGSAELQTGMNINPDAHGTDPNTFLGLDWVRFPFKAAAKSRNLTAAFAEYDPIVEAFAKNGIAVLFVLNQETYWGNAPWQNGDWESYAAQFGATAGAIADHYAIYGNLVAFEIWTEPDASPTDPSALGISAGNYSLVLDSAAEAISLAAPRSPIIFASLASGASNGIRYVALVENALGRGLPVNAIGLHPYGSWGTFDPVYNEQFSN
jgi:hypothetical protein